ncbi:hypothetical protein [uncultured Pontibacter sp.]|uniref:hypothetical protein n=1 Tax=uncultured Pontibacter sp. TaxID=453356 RepID=UPI002615B6C6|nr:hypothetical protein [uncultured Pontibacter sp.]
MMKAKPEASEKLLKKNFALVVEDVKTLPTFAARFSRRRFEGALTQAGEKEGKKFSKGIASSKKLPTFATRSETSASPSRTGRGEKKKKIEKLLGSWKVFPTFAHRKTTAGCFGKHKRRAPYERWGGYWKRKSSESSLRDC